MNDIYVVAGVVKQCFLLRLLRSVAWQRCAGLRPIFDGAGALLRFEGFVNLLLAQYGFALGWWAL